MPQRVSADVSHAAGIAAGTRSTAAFEQPAPVHDAVVLVAVPFAAQQLEPELGLVLELGLELLVVVDDKQPVAGNCALDITKKAHQHTFKNLQLKNFYRFCFSCHFNISTSFISI